MESSPLKTRVGGGRVCFVFFFGIWVQWQPRPARITDVSKREEKVTKEQQERRAIVGFLLISCGQKFLVKIGNDAFLGLALKMDSNMFDDLSF